MALRTRMAIRNGDDWYESERGYIKHESAWFFNLEGFEKNSGSWYPVFIPVFRIGGPDELLLNQINIYDELGFTANYNPPAIIEIYINEDSVIKTFPSSEGIAYGIDTQGLNSDAVVRVIVEGVLAGRGGAGGNGGDTDSYVYATQEGRDLWAGYDGEDGLPAARLTLPVTFLGSGVIAGACGGGGGGHMTLSDKLYSNSYLRIQGGGGGGGAPTGSFGSGARGGSNNQKYEDVEAQSGEYGGTPWPQQNPREPSESGGQGGAGMITTKGEEGRPGSAGRGFDNPDEDTSEALTGATGANASPFLIEGSGSADTSSFDGTIFDPTA